MKEIPLTQGKVALIDDEDFELVSQYKWHAHKNKNVFYARSSMDGENILLHRFILNTPDGIEIDHKDRDGLNCTRENMRLATHTQNNANRGMLRNNTSGYRGVRFYKASGSWQSAISVNAVHKHLGYFDSPIEAARAYDEAAHELFGEFAQLNFE